MNEENKIESPNDQGSVSSHYSDSTFEAEYQCEPQVSDLIYSYGLSYHRRCETYDQVHCTGRLGNVAMPKTPRESALIGQNAKLVKRELTAQIINDGHAETWQDAEEKLRSAIDRSEREFKRELASSAQRS